MSGLWTLRRNLEERVFETPAGQWSRQFQGTLLGGPDTGRPEWWGTYRGISSEGKYRGGRWAGRERRGLLDKEVTFV